MSKRPDQPNALSLRFYVFVVSRFEFMNWIILMKVPHRENGVLVLFSSLFIVQNGK